MGKITVNVQTEKRLNAITNLSEAILEVAKALSCGTSVNVTGCTIYNSDPGISISTVEEVTDTLISSVDDDAPIKKAKKK